MNLLFMRQADLACVFILHHKSWIFNEPSKHRESRFRRFV